MVVSDILNEKHLSWLAYFVLIVGVLFAWKTEHRDIHCPDLNNSDQKECEEGGGASFAWTKPKDSDTCKELLDKIYRAAGAEVNAVKWRKALTLSVGIMGTMWLLVGYNKTEKGVPDWRILFLSIAIAFIIIIGSYLYYSCHVYGVAEKWIRESVRQLERQGCIVEPDQGSAPQDTFRYV
jgi:hypothetical protein